MSFFLSIIGLVSAGLALLHLLRLETRHLAVDLALAWFVGGGWFATVVAALRFLAGVAYTPWVAVLVLATPILAWGLRARCFPRAAAPGALLRTTHRFRWPRPLWLFGPLMAYVLFTAYVVTAHGIDTPTQTDDGLRVRAFTPVLALDDGWNEEARALLPVAGTVPTWVPSLAWRLTGRLDAFHVNYTVLASFLALLVLLVSLGSSRGRPEQGWVGAFAVLSLPLFVYHCTSTYTDAVLAIHIGVSCALLFEYTYTRDPADAARALLGCVVAACVKREGTLLAACVAGPLLVQLAWRHHCGFSSGFRRLTLFLLPVLIDLATGAAAVGPRRAFPILELVVSGGAAAANGAHSADTQVRAAAAFFRALFLSGNAGMLYWVLTATVAARSVTLTREGRALPLFALAALFAVTALSSIWLIPEFTLDETAVHRALLTVSVAAAIWVAVTLCDWVRPRHATIGCAPAHSSAHVGQAVPSRE